jgi:hypothetical protein
MAKVGRPRNVETPEDMYNLFKEYKTYVKGQPKIQVHTKPKEQEIW